MMHARDAKPVLEFQRHRMSVTILRLLSASAEVLARELDRRVQVAPERFRYLPVILDVRGVASTDLYIDLPGLVALLRNRDLIPVGIRGGDERWARAADAAGLRTSVPEPDPTARTQSSAAPAKLSIAKPALCAAPETAARSPTLVVTEPVRSGQQHYARGGDLVILASVSFGAEVSADGHIHVYGPLQGRALAGVSGDKSARIFCRAFRPDFVSIAGVYAVSEQFDDALLGEPVQVSLHHDALRMERLP